MTSRSHLALLLGAPIALAGCAGGAETSAADKPERPPVNVSVQRLAPSSLTESVELSGELQPWVAVDVSAELGGRVESVSFREGQRVAAGSVLARIGADILEAALEESKANRIAAEANYVKTEKLFERQSVPRQDLIAATARFDTAKAQEEQARLRVERSIIRAPISGVALRRELEPGEVLAPGAPVTTLHQVDRLKAAAGIPESEIAGFEERGAAAIEVDAWPDERFEGRIHFIGPAASTSTRTFPVEVAIDNRDGRLRPGMIARVSLVRQQHEDVVAVERDVLQERDDGTVAVVLDGDVARVRQVELGASQGNRVVVTEGLAPDDWLIVSGQRGLVDGQRVAVVERSEP